jgi:hypothetical protein
MVDQPDMWPNSGRTVELVSQISEAGRESDSAAHVVFSSRIGKNLSLMGVPCSTVHRSELGSNETLRHLERATTTSTSDAPRLAPGSTRSKHMARSDVKAWLGCCRCAPAPAR